MGTSHAKNLAGRVGKENVDVTHVCDVYNRRLNAAARITGGILTCN
ncbi:MAG: hypothetical protein ACI9GC_000957 [Phycisphaerales bacterium]|jgi:hypothetical protein